MLTPITYGLAIVLDLFVIFIGARFLLAPSPRPPAMASRPSSTATPRT